ncbi:all trans-polyprenyl-diphosphate synthase PDSS1-like isoform X2 [Oculina patagonica]
MAGAAALTCSFARLSSCKHFASRNLIRDVKKCEIVCRRNFSKSYSFRVTSISQNHLPASLCGRSHKPSSCLAPRNAHNSARLWNRSLFRYCCRYCSTSSHVEKKVNDPQALTKAHLSHLCEAIKKELNSSITPLREVSHYYFDGQGKYIRPMIVLLAAGACNSHTSDTRTILPSQETVVMVSEMIHTASLVHDDVIDGADTRRGKISVNKMFGEKMSVLAGDYILSCASQALAKLGNSEVVELLAKVVDDLVKGELMQLGSKEHPDERFNHYLEKTYKKTASLIACCCKAVSVFGNCSPAVQEIAFQYGRNIGMAFQVVDDILDFIASDGEMGKPTATDLKLGLATAPVLFACEQFPDLNALIMRRFKGPNDVEEARQAVHKSDGIARSYTLASQYAKEAVKQINKLSPSPERDALVSITHQVLQRRK